MEDPIHARDQFCTAAKTTTNLTVEANDGSTSNPRTSRCNKRSYSSILDDEDERDVRQQNQHRSKSPSICSSTDTTSAHQFPGKKLSSHFCCLTQCHVSATSKKMGGQSYELFPLPQLKSVRLKWALYVHEIDRFASTHSIDSCRVCELHFVDRKPTARNPFPTQNLLGSNYNGADRSVRAVNQLETLNGSTIGRTRSGERSMISDSPIITESTVPMDALKPTGHVVGPSSMIAGKKSGIAFNTRSSRSFVSNFQTSTPVQMAPAHTVLPNPNSRADSIDSLVDHRSIEWKSLNSAN
uniref:THAP-type domain-containing protein n=1 Tax=Romanomermis culicivorax TaxID=13658 RepID=A0A915JF33_ROMCU